MKRIVYALRQLLSVAALPFVVAVVVPIYVSRRNHTPVEIASSPSGVALQVFGVAVLLAGLALFVSSLWRFASEGRGTLAPWDPPREFVASGPYRYVRHPMISGVFFTLVGESMVLRSVPHVEWAAAFFAINAVYLPLVEEPQLTRRFGAQYEEYCRHVRRLVPRVRPWRRT